MPQPPKLEVLNEAFAQVWSPVLRGNQKRLSLSTSRSPTGRGEHIGPRIKHRQQKVAAIGIRRRHDHWFLRKVQICDGLQRIEIHPDYEFVVARRIGSGACEGVHWSLLVVFCRARRWWSRARRDQRLHQSPFVVGQIARISQLAAVVTGAVLARPHR